MGAGARPQRTIGVVQEGECQRLTRMTTESWPLDRAGELADLYNEQVDTIPYAFQVAPTILAQAAQTQHESLVNECLIVGLEGTVPQACLR